MATGPTILAIQPPPALGQSVYFIGSTAEPGAAWLGVDRIGHWPASDAALMMKRVGLVRDLTEMWKASKQLGGHEAVRNVEEFRKTLIERARMF